MNKICLYCNKKFEDHTKSKCCCHEHQLMYKNKQKYPDGSDFVECKICKFRAANLHWHIKKIHLMTINEYCNKFNIKEIDLQTKTLRKNNYELPIEINGLLIMVKKLIQFVRDSHIEPMMKINSIREVIASDVEFCNYEGTPFNTPEEKKTVKVVSPGWIYKDKELQISRPKVKEEE